MKSTSKRLCQPVKEKLKQDVIFMISLYITIRYNSIIPETLLENGDMLFKDPAWNAFMQRQIDNQTELVRDYIQQCNSEEELQKIQKLVINLIQKARDATVDQGASLESINEISSVEHPTATWKESLFLFAGLSLGIITLWYSTSFLFSMANVIVNITILQTNILSQIDVLLKINPEEICTVFNSLDW